MSATRRNASSLSYEFEESIEWHLERGHKLIRLHKYDGSTGDPKAPCDKGWRSGPGLTRRQAFAAATKGHNIGWAPTGEHLIIDVDMHGHDGIATYKKFKKILPPEKEIPRVDSSRGGFHLYFRKEKTAKVTASRLKKKYGKGVDIVANVQVVIPASIHPVTNKPYKFTNMPDEIPFWTEELEELLTQRRTPKHKAKPNDTLPSINAVEQIVGAIPNDDDTEYDGWFATGCAIHKSTEGSEEGYEIFATWSSLNPLYDDDYTRQKWESMGQYGGEMRGFGSLVEEARQHDPQIVSNVIYATSYISAQDDFKDLPPPDKTFDINKRAWRLVEEELSYDNIQPDEWYYSDVLPKGAYAAMAGRQGLGKSSLIMHLAACITTGKPFPGDERNPVTRGPGDVIYFSVEERIKQSILPKLRNSGADLKRFHAFRAGVVSEDRNGEEKTRGFSVTDGLRQLEDVIKKYPDTKLVIFDPITMFIIHANAQDGNNTATMNQSLAPLNKLAEDYELCILGITHFNKSGGRGLDKVTGSIAHTTVARHVCYLLPHFIENRTIVATAKSNMFTDKTSYVFEGVEIEPENIKGFTTPLRQRTLHLVERNDEHIDADEWERRVDIETQDKQKRTAVEHLSGQITEHIAEHSLQTHYWTSKTFKDYFRSRYANHDKTFDQTMSYMVEQKMLYQENVGGSWYIWYLDGMIADDPEELEEFNVRIRQRILDEHKPPKQELADLIFDYVESEFPLEVPYDDLYNVFLDHTERQIQTAIRLLVNDSRLMRIHIKKEYFLTSL